MPNSALFTPTMRVGQHFRALLPRKLRDKVPARQRPLTWPSATHTRKMLMLAGCVQPSMMPNVNTATARVLDALGIETRGRARRRLLRRDPCTSATTTKRSTTCAPTSTHGGRMSNRASRRS